MSTGRQRFQLNPAFAAAHGIVDTQSSVTTNAAVAEAAQTNQGNGIKTKFSKIRFQQSLDRARESGKLQLASMGLTLPLPDELFDLRSLGAKVDLSMGSVAPVGQQHAEETVTVIDLSDNDLSGGDDSNQETSSKVAAVPASSSSSSKDAVACDPPSFLNFVSLQVLRLRQCQISILSNDLARAIPSYHSLMLLDVAGNHLTEFDLSILPNTLQELDLSNNKIRAIRYTISSTSSISLPQLRRLDMANNEWDGKIAATDVVTLRLSRLQQLDISHNRLTSVPYNTLLQDSVQSLTSIDLSHNHICEMDNNQCFGAFAKLETLNMAHNQLSGNIIPSLSPSMFRFDVSNNKLTNIGGITAASSTANDYQYQLKELILRDNHLAEVNGNLFKRFSNLERLDLSSNLLKNLPYQLGWLKALKSLHVTSNPLWAFSTVDTSSTKELLETLRTRTPSEETSEETAPSLSSYLSSVLVGKHTLDLRNGKATIDRLEHLSGELSSMSSSGTTIGHGITGKCLLEKNQLRAIPDGFLEAMPNLSILEACNNRLFTLPNSLISTLARLTTLDLSRNQLTSIPGRNSPPTFAGTLQTLNLASNRLSDVPIEWMRYLSNLRIIDLSDNKIESVDQWTNLPVGLERLNFADNRISSLDDLPLILAAQCPELQSLSLQRNDLKRIPWTLGVLLTPQFKHIDLKQNPQRLIRQHILEQSAHDQLLYLKNRMTAGELGEITKRISSFANAGSTSGAAAEKDETIKETADTDHLIADNTNEDTNTNSMMTANTETPAMTNEILLEQETTACSKAEPPTESGDNTTNEVDDEVQKRKQELETSIHSLAEQLENASLSQAKRFALKKALAMERSKLIRLERQS